MIHKILSKSHMLLKKKLHIKDKKIQKQKSCGQDYSNPMQHKQRISEVVTRTWRQPESLKQEAQHGDRLSWSILKMNNEVAMLAII